MIFGLSKEEFYGLTSSLRGWFAGGGDDIAESKIGEALLACAGEFKNDNKSSSRNVSDFAIEAIASRTPTQFDLGRWLFERIVVLEGEPKTRIECLELMSEVMGAIRPIAREKRDAGD